MEDKIEIPISKVKMILLLVGASILVVLGMVFIINPDLFQSLRFRSSTLIQLIGLLSLAFFGLIQAFLVKRLADTNMGLIIDDHGITDHSSGASVGLIDWEDITNIRAIQISSTKILIIEVNKPKKYIQRAKGAISKKAMMANHKLYGSPLSISAVSLKIKHEELK